MRICLVCLLLFMWFQTPAFADKRVALVIGNSSYQRGPKLSTPARDAIAMADLLNSAGFDTVGLRTDLDNTEFRRTVREFTVLSREADIVLVFFAGHGLQANGENYLLPIDAVLTSELDAEDQAISLNRIVRMLDLSKGLRLIILNANPDNPFSGTMSRVNKAAVSGGLGEPKNSESNMLIAYAAKAGATGVGADGPYSPYTEALLKHLATPGLDVRIALGRVRDEVLKNTNNRQEPYVYGSLGGSPISVVPPPPTSPSTSAPAAPSASDIRRDYELAMRIGTEAAYQAFLTKHNEGLYAQFARAALAKLQASQKAAPAAPAPESR